MDVPKVRGEWPNMTSGNMYREEWIETVYERLDRLVRDRSRKQETVARITNNLIPAGWQSATPMHH